MPSTPKTPGTPPLFGGFSGDKPTRNPKKSLLNKGSNCFSVETWPDEEGNLPAVTCTITMPPPPVPIAKKVLCWSFIHLGDSFFHDQPFPTKCNAHRGGGVLAEVSLLSNMSFVTFQKLRIDSEYRTGIRQVTPKH